MRASRFDIASPWASNQEIGLLGSLPRTKSEIRDLDVDDIPTLTGAQRSKRLQCLGMSFEERLDAGESCQCRCLQRGGRCRKGLLQRGAVLFDEKGVLAPQYGHDALPNIFEYYWVTTSLVKNLT